MRLLGNMLDRIILVCGVLFGGALQSFIIQYRQNASGHFHEALANLEKFQKIAKNHFSGDLQALIYSYLESTDASVRETGVAIQEIKNSILFWNSALDSLKGNPISQLWGMIRYFRSDTIIATWHSYQPAFSFSTDALIMAAVVGGAIWVICIGIAKFIGFYMVRRNST